jgi:hypothetical protein
VKLFSKWTAILVLLFVILFTWALMVEADVTLGLGFGASSSGGVVTQRLGYLHDDKWWARYERMGGDDWNTANTYAAGRRVFVGERRARPFMELGATYSDSQLQRDGKRPNVSDNWTFRLGAGVSYRLSDVARIEVGIDHDSTAGRSLRNRGVDRVYLQYQWRTR